MNQGKTSLRQKLVRSLFGQSKSSRRRRNDMRFRRRFESLESRLLLHGGVDHGLDDHHDHIADVGEAEHAGVNGPHSGNPTYNLNQFHIHAQLDIYVNGQKVPIPTFGGVSGGDSIHTHDATGLIHLHPTAPRTTFIKLGEVFDAWKAAPSGGNSAAGLTHTSLMGNTVNSTHRLHMFVNGVKTEAYENYQLRDGDSIVLNYTSNPIITLNTTIGPIQMELFRDKTPITVNNFLNYVNGGDYNNSFFHRYVPGFVMQGGGFKTGTNTFNDPTVANQFTAVTTDPEIQNEFDNFAKRTGTGAAITTSNNVINLGSNVDLSNIQVGDRIRLNGRTDGIGQSNMFDITAVNDTNNTVTVQQTPTGASASNVAWAIFPKVNLTGTVAMAKLGGNEDSATSQFFINLGNNDSNLDLQNGGFTVFAQILDTTLLTDISTLNDLSLFSANLTGAQEVPAVTTSATGSAMMALNKVNNQFDLSLNVTGITQNNLTQSHIHVGAINQEGDPIFDLGAGSQYTASGNSLTRTIDNGAFPTARLNDLQQNRTYVNVHTNANPDGEIRGQLSSFQNGLYSDLPTTTTNSLVTIQSVVGDGEIRGSVYNDADSDGVKDQAETGRQGVTVYVDANNNSQLDTGETSTTTDSSGNYNFRLASGSHRIRMVSASGQTLTGPAGGFFEVNVLIGGQVTGRDFGVSSITGLTGLDLVDVSDTGSSATDNVTNLNNSAANKTLQFRVNGVTDGAIVRILADGNVIGQATAPAGSNGTLIVTTNGTATVGEGARSITATQTIGTTTTPASAALTVNIDSTLADFTSTAPTTATVGTAVSYNAQHAEEGQTGFVYSLNNAPTGATINAQTGVVAWTPAANQTGAQTFSVVATDLAGNTRTQPVTLQVTKTPQVRYDMVVTDTNGNPITQIQSGGTFQLRVSVTDVRANIPAAERGVFAGYHDVTFNQNLATATTITHSPQFGNSPSGTISAGLLDEVGSFTGSLTPSGAGTFLIYTATFTASRSGTLVFTGDAPDIIPSHNLGVYGEDDPVPLDEVFYGTTTLTVLNPIDAENDSFNFDEDTTNNTLNVLSNDTGPSGSTLTVIAAGTTNKGGTVTVATGGGSLRYTPAANFFGEETFTYTVSDGTNEGIATVTVQVHPVNDSPTAVNDTFNVAEDAQSVALAVLQNDKTDPDGPAETLKVKTVTQPANGTVTIDNNGLAVRFTPTANFIGTTTFTYTIEDSGNPALTSTAATATVTVTAANDPPTVVNDSVTAVEDSENTVFNVLANDSFAPDVGETLTITAVTAGSRGGVVTIVQNGTRVNYTPADNIFGNETFTYTVSDGNGGTATGTVTVAVTAVNDAPDAVNDAITVAKNSQNNILQVLTNDLITPDADETLTISAVTQGNQGGTITIVENGTRIRYVPANNFLGTETFSYTVRDPGGLTDTATVTITVREFVPSSLAGFVYLDSDNDGIKDTGEQGLSGVQIALTGTDNFGQAVNVTATTDTNGAYSFTNLAPGNYKIKETQPTTQIGGQQVSDGKDTVGSAGGTASANDEFTITLAENVNATGYNFGETTGFRIIGKLVGAAAGGLADATSSIALNGVQVQLFAANAQNQPTGSAMKTVTLKADGSFTFDGISPGQYVVSATAPTFLQLLNGGNQAVTISNADSVNSVVLQAARQAQFITYRDFMNSTPRQGIFAAINVDSKTQVWSGLDSNWTGFSEATIQPTTDNARLRLELTQTNGQKVFDEIPMNDGRIHTIATNGNTKLFRLQGASTNYNLRAVPATGGAGEGEGEGESFDSGSATQMVAPGILDSSASSLGENNGVVSPSDQDLSFVLDVDSASSLTADGEGESSSDRLDAIDAALAESADTPYADESFIDGLAADQADELDDADPASHEAAIEQTFADLLESLV